MARRIICRRTFYSKKKHTFEFCLAYCLRQPRLSKCECFTRWSSLFHSLLTTAAADDQIKELERHKVFHRTNKQKYLVDKWNSSLSLSLSSSLLNSIWGHSELSFLETDLWIKLRARQREKKNLKSVTVWRNTELKELLTGPPNKDTQNINPQLSHQEMNRFSFMSRSKGQLRFWLLQQSLLNKFHL